MTPNDLHKDHRKRMRARYIKDGGFDAFDDHKILEFLLFYAVPRRDTNELAHKMINAYNGIANLINADPQDIARRCGVSESVAVLVSMVPQLSRWYIKLCSDAQKSDALDTPAKAGQYALGLLSGKADECFYCISLNIKRRAISADLLSKGGVSRIEIIPREIARLALKHNATSVILAHNHPSSDVLPSQDDRAATAVIAQALDVLDVAVADHIITGAGNYFSFAEAGLL
jgi:DNA repair protein RadC